MPLPNHNHTFYRSVPLPSTTTRFTGVCPCHPQSHVLQVVCPCHPQSHVLQVVCSCHPHVLQECAPAIHSHTFYRNVPLPSTRFTGVCPCHQQPHVLQECAPDIHSHTFYRSVPLPSTATRFTRVCPCPTTTTRLIGVCPCHPQPHVLQECAPAIHIHTFFRSVPLPSTTTRFTGSVPRHTPNETSQGINHYLKKRRAKLRSVGQENQPRRQTQSSPNPNSVQPKTHAKDFISFHKTCTQRNS